MQFTKKVKQEMQEKIAKLHKSSKKTHLSEIFIKNGYIADPKKAYHLEFVFKDGEQASQLAQTLNELGIKASVVKRKNSHITYVKDGEHIADFLSITYAHSALMDFQNVRILKDISANINRAVNLETANISKTISAALAQKEDIKFILDHSKYVLDPPLQELATIRLNNMEATMQELGEMCNPPVSKSCVNHRLRKIKKIAQQLRKKTSC